MRPTSSMPVEPPPSGRMVSAARNAAPTGPHRARISSAPMDTPRVARFVEDRRQDFTDALRDLVNVDSGSYSPEGVNKVADLLEERFRGSGWQVERRPHRPEGGQGQLGDVLIARVEGSGTHRVLLVCHM